MPMPKPLTIPFARDALSQFINEIPDTPQAGADPQLASWSEGFGPITMQPLHSGGKPPEGPDFNGILSAISEHIVYQNGGGIYMFSQEYVDKTGGYDKDSVLIGDDGSALWVSLSDNNTENFNTASPVTKWIKIGIAGVEQQIQDILTQLDTVVEWVSGDKIITVADSGGDFTTVMGAVAEAMKWRSIDGSVIVEIQSGYLVKEQLFFIDNDYSHINIRAQNGATIIVDHNSMSVTDFEGSETSGFILCARGKSPMFHAQFEFLTRPASTISGALAIFNGEIYFGNDSGVKRAGAQGAAGNRGGSVTMGNNNNFSGAGTHGALGYGGGSVTMGEGNNFSGVAVGGYSFNVSLNGLIQAGSGTIFTTGRERSQAAGTITAHGLIMG